MSFGSEFGVKQVYDQLTPSADNKTLLEEGHVTSPTFRCLLPLLFWFDCCFRNLLGDQDQQQNYLETQPHHNFLPVDALVGHSYVHGRIIWA